MVMDFNTKSGLGLIIGIIVLILVGTALIEPLATNLAGMDDLNTVNNESLTIASGTGTSANDDVQTVTRIVNGTITGNVSLSNETVAVASGTGTTAFPGVTAVNFIVNSSGIMVDVTAADFNFTVGGVMLLNTSFGDGNYLVTYDYIPTSIIVNTAAADFNFTSETGVMLFNTSYGDGTYLLTYDYRPNTFVNDTTSRTILNATILLFFALAVLIAVMGWFMRGGIMDFFNKQ